MKVTVCNEGGYPLCVIVDNDLTKDSRIGAGATVELCPEELLNCERLK